jgi:hypothetical protein
MKSIQVILSLFMVTAAYTQPNTAKIADSIEQEGRRLYRSEMASWYGTDIFVEKFKDQLSDAKGYFSYDEGKMTNCIFFSKDETPKVLATFSFDSTYSTETVKIDSKQRDFSPREKDIYAIRKLALELINSDTMFKIYEGSNLNLIPLVENGEKKVYVLSGPKAHGVVIFGNDYLLTFDAHNNLATKKRLHMNILPMNYNTKQDEDSFGTMHTHLPETGEFMTATDVCTLMLYQKFAQWKQHIVVSEKYMSIWHCGTNHLTIIPR